jgi:hypothetical protein
MQHTKEELVLRVDLDQNVSAQKNDMVYLEGIINGTDENSKKVYLKSF